MKTYRTAFRCAVIGILLTTILANGQSQTASDHEQAVAQLTISLERAKADLDSKQAQLSRSTQLYKSGMVSQSEVSAAQASAAQATADVLQVQQNLQRETRLA